MSHFILLVGYPICQLDYLFSGRATPYVFGDSENHRFPEFHYTQGDQTTKRPIDSILTTILLVSQSKSLFATEIHRHRLTPGARL